MTDPLSAVASMLALGLILCVPIAAGEGLPAPQHSSAWVWLVVSGASDVAGLAIAYKAFRIGQASLVSPLISTEGALAAVIAVIAGESLGAGATASLLLAAIGVCIASIAPRGPEQPADSSVVAHARQTPHVKVVGFALAAALSFGLSLYSTARAGAVLPSGWVVLSARAVGAVALALPLGLSKRMRIPRAAIPYVSGSAVCEVAGFFAYTIGSRHGIAIAAVLAAQFSTLVVAAGYFFLGERLTRVQLSGVCTVIVGVALVSLATS